MKKIYINPTTQIVELKTQQNMMLTASGTTNETSGNLSRRRNDVWDEKTTTINVVIRVDKPDEIHNIWN